MSLCQYCVSCADDPSPGDAIGDYILEDLVIATSMSAVFLCTCKTTGEKLICKCIRRLFNRMTRVEQEVQVQQALNHPLILSVVEAFPIQRHEVLILPLARFGSLSSFIKERYPCGVPETMAKVIAQQMLQALQFLHEQNIIHCDIKCSNYLVFSDSMIHPKVQLADFGLVQQLSGPGELSTELSGTFSHKAPEMWTERVRGKCSDVWALGIAMFELLVGYCPFEYKVRTEKGRRLLGEHICLGPTFLEKDWRYVSREGRAFVARLLTVDRGQRPTVSDALADVWLTSMCGEKETAIEESVGRYISDLPDVGDAMGGGL